MVGPNTMLTSSQWIKRNMLGEYSQKLGRPLNDAEIRVQRCLEKLQVPDWYKNYAKPTTKFLKNDTPIECRPPSWKAMKGKPRATPKKSASPRKEQPHADDKIQKPAAVDATMTNARESLNANYRIARKADKAKDKDRLSISITPSSSDNETEPRLARSKQSSSSNLSKSLHSALNNSNTFPRMRPSRKIENINIVFPENFSPKPPAGQAQEQQVGCASSTPNAPRTQYTFTKNIQLAELDLDECESNKSSHTSFLFAELQPCGVSKTVQVFAGMDSAGSDSEHDQWHTARGSASPHSRFFSSRNKSSELERIVQTCKQDKRGNSLIREIIGELDRSIAESRRGREPEQANGSQQMVKGIVRAFEQESGDEQEGSSDEDSELAKSTSISFKSSDENVASLEGDGDGDDEQGTRTPTPTFDNCLYSEEEPQQQESQEQDVYWIPSKIHDLARTSSRLSMLSRGSSRSGFQCTSGRCSPALSPIKCERARSDWGSTLSSYRSRKASRQLFRIDETATYDSGCYCDRSAATSSPNTHFTDNRSPSPSPSLTSSSSSSPTLTDYITSDMLLNISSRHFALNSIQV